MNTIDILKAQNEDFEWYPTTHEIFNTIQKDLKKIAKTNRYSSKEDPVYCSDVYDRTLEKNVTKVIIDSVIDIGAGDGRLFDYFDFNTYSIDNKLAIEKSEHLANILINRGVFLIGRDFFKCTLVDKFYSVIFSNPPYSIYEEWLEKILLEGNAYLLYFVIPQRWKNNQRLIDLANEKGEVAVLSTFDFSDAERKARCTVDVVRIKCKVNSNDFTKSFNTWIEQNIGKFEKEEVEEEVSYDPNVPISNKENKIFQLVENYQKDMESLIDVYQSLAKINFSLLEQIGLSKESLIHKIKDDIISLKQKYWNIAFSFLEPIQKRLTYASRQDLLREIQKFGGIDFTEDNIYNIVLWVIKNFNKNSQNQLLNLFDKLTDFEGVNAYKSNDKWISGGWRYTKDVPEKYKLDYRIVSRMYHRDYSLSYDIRSENTLIHDILIVMESLGFVADSRYVEIAQDGKLRSIEDKDGNTIFTYRYYQNSNVHLKFDQKLMLKFNIEAGKLKGWLKKPHDIQDEFDLDEKEALYYFTNDQINYVSKKTLLLA